MIDRAVVLVGPQGRILDYGCGSGEVVAAGRAAGLDVHGVELFYAGSRARQEVEARGLMGKEILELGPEGRIPHEDAVFDVVVSNQVLEHVEDLARVLGEIERVLKPGGSLLCLFPASEVVREGHCGVPFAHWFAKGSRLRHWWLLGFRAAGFGYHKAGKGRVQWARDFGRWLDDYTFYRGYDEIRQSFAARFPALEHREEDYVAYRLAAGRLAALAPMARAWPLRAAARFACRRLASMVIVASKAV